MAIQNQSNSKLPVTPSVLISTGTLPGRTPPSRQPASPSQSNGRRLYKKHLTSRPQTHAGLAAPQAPLLTFKDGSPLTTRFMAHRWSQALQAASLSTTGFSLHRVRKSRASYTYNQCGTDLNEVMSQGTWRSAAVRTYIKPQEAAPNSVPTTLSAL